MFREDLLPEMLAIGMTEEQFWKSNPKKIKPYIKAYELRTKEIDAQNWMLGMYVRDALNSCLMANSQMFRGKAFEPIKYPEKPYLEEVERRKPVEQMTEEEIQAEVDKFFATESARQKNWSARHNSN